LSQLRSQSLRKRYKSRTVVQDVSLEVSSGEVVGLLGPNGAGKTTCFYMIVGLVPVDAGTIFLEKAELTHLPIHKRARLGISYLPQENSVFRRLTVEENVKAILELQGLAAEEEVTLHMRLSTLGNLRFELGFLDDGHRSDDRIRIFVDLDALGCLDVRNVQRLVQAKAADIHIDRCRSITGFAEHSDLANGLDK